MKDYEVFEPVGGKQGKMEIQLDTSSLSPLFKRGITTQNFLFLSPWAQWDVLRINMDFFLLIPIFLYTSLLLSNVMLQNFVKFNLVSWCWVTQRYTYLLTIYAL